MVMWRFEKKLLAEFIENYFGFSRGKDGRGWREWAILRLHSRGKQNFGTPPETVLVLVVFVEP